MSFTNKSADKHFITEITKQGVEICFQTPLAQVLQIIFRRETNYHSLFRGGETDFLTENWTFSMEGEGGGDKI